MKSACILFLVMVCTKGVVSLMSSDCAGEHCHAEEEEERAVLYFLTGDSCFVIGKYNPFYDEEPPKVCPKGTELYWKDISEMTKEEKASLGLKDVDMDDLEEIDLD